MASIKQTFFQECEEQLAELETGLLAISDGDSDPETVNAVFRAVHSIKGGAGAFHLTELVQFAHVFESALDLVRTGRLSPSAAVLKTMLRAADVLADVVRAARDEEPLDKSKSEPIVAELVDLTSRGPVRQDAAAGDHFEFVPIAVDLADLDLLLDPSAPPTRPYRIAFTPARELYAKGNETTVLFRELGLLGTMSVTCDTDGLPAFGELDPEAAYLSWSLALETDQGLEAIREVFDFVEGDCTLSIVEEQPCDAEGGHAVSPNLQADAPPAAAAAVGPAPHPKHLPTPSADEATVADGSPAERRGAVAAMPTIRVDLERVDRLIDLVGELVINQAMLAERVTEAGIARVSAVAIGLDELEQLTREIQDSVMAIRAQPVKSVFQRMPRLAREVAEQTGKSVRLITEGEGTEVDKTVIERLGDPLTHMIRNAIDHGVERPDVRRASGKPAEGIIRLSALHRSGRIVIEVADDGAGINRDRVRQTAIDKGLVPADAKLSDDEIDNLIFLPGFSTAETVSDISGRGVGMDVVRRSIQALGGRISISSRPGRGSTFTMSLPLTLAVLDGMVVTVAGQTLVVPLTAVIETLLPKATTVFAYGEDARVIGVRNGFLPLIDVGRVMGYRAEPADAGSGIALLVEAEGGARCALLVDAIQGQRQVVIKSLELNYRPVPGIAAATILGDGRVALILDVDAIVADARAEQTTFDIPLALAG